MDFRIRTKPFSMVPNVLLFALIQMNLSQSEHAFMVGAISYINYGKGGEKKDRLDLKVPDYIKNHRTAKGNMYRAMQKLIDRGMVKVSKKARLFVIHDLAQWYDPTGSIKQGDYVAKGTQVFYEGSPAYHRLLNMYQAQNGWNGLNNKNPFEDSDFRIEQDDFDEESADQYYEDLADEYDDEGLTGHPDGFNETPSEGLTGHPNGFNETPNKVSLNTQKEGSGYPSTPNQVSHDTQRGQNSPKASTFDRQLYKQSCLRKLKTTDREELTLYATRFCKLRPKELQNILRYAPDNLQRIYDFLSHLAALVGNKKADIDIVPWSRWQMKDARKWDSARNVPTFEGFQQAMKDKRTADEQEKKSKNRNISSSEDSSSRDSADGPESGSDGSKKQSLMHLAQQFASRSLAEQKTAAKILKRQGRYAQSETITAWIDAERPDSETSFFLSHFANLGRAEEILEIRDIKLRQRESAVQAAMEKIN